MNAMLDQIQNAAARYGPNGDNSLECIGLTAIDQTLSDLKIYRLYQRDPSAAPIDLPKPLDGFARRFAALDVGSIARIADISAGGAGERLRLCVKFRTDVPPGVHRAALEQVNGLLNIPWGVSPAAIDDDIQAAISPGRSSVVQLGAELDETGAPCVRKSYFMLRDNSNPRDYYFRFLPIPAMTELLRGIWALCGCGDRGLNEFAAYAPRLEALDYHPFLLGLNQSAKGTECKIYFMLQPYDRRRDHLAAHSRAALEAMDCMGAFPPTFTDEADHAGLFLRGAGFYASPQTLGWKIYFAPKHP